MKIGLLLIILMTSTPLVACVATPQPPLTPLPTSTLDPAQDPSFQSNGGGEPRSSGYWLIWNSCAEGNQSETARANGGQAAGWIIMDDLLANPGILVGELSVETCLEGLNLLQERDSAGTSHENDVAYTLAAQLLAAQLNLAAAAETCPAAEQAVGGGQLLLLTLSFDGTGTYLGPPIASSDMETARVFTEKLSDYNSGALCLY